MGHKCVHARVMTDHGGAKIRLGLMAGVNISHN